MASKEKKSGGDFILESRHLVGLFLLLVVIFGVVFTLGYLLGRSQYDSQLRAVVGPPRGSDVQAASPASKSKTRPESEVAQLPKKNSDWDFYHSADAPKNEDHLQPVPKPVTAWPHLRRRLSRLRFRRSLQKPVKTLGEHGRSADSERRDHAPSRGRNAPG